MGRGSLWERYGLGQISQDFLRVDRFATPLRQEWDGDEESLEKFSWELDHIYLAHLAEQTAMVDGAKELLSFLRAHRYNIGVLSNGFKDLQNKGQHLMIGDNLLTDIAGAIGAGWHAVHFDPTAEGLREEKGMTVTPRLKLLERLF